MPTINTIADYMTAIARINLCTPTNILTTTHNQPESTIRLQAYQILAHYGTPKEMKFARGWLNQLATAEKQYSEHIERTTVEVHPEPSVSPIEPAQEATVDIVV